MIRNREELLRSITYIVKSGAGNLFVRFHVVKQAGLGANVFPTKKMVAPRE